MSPDVFIDGIQKVDIELLISKLKLADFLIPFDQI